MSIVSRIESYHRGREPERLAIKYARIATDATAFFRGTPNLFYEDWDAQSPLSQATPRVWLCGDLHLENFGCYRGDNRCTYFDFNDFDEACLGPAAWDLTRLLASIAIEGAERKWRSKQTASLCASVIDSYAGSLATGKARWVERETAAGVIADLFHAVNLRTSQALLGKRTAVLGRTRQLRKDGVKALPLTGRRDERRLEAFVESYGGGLRYLDGARRIAGNSSLGIPRFVLLVEDKRDDLFLLDLKQARPAVALQFHPDRAQPKWKNEAARVTGVQTMVQAIPPAFLRPVEYEDEPWVLREMQPAEDRVEVGELTNRQFLEHAASLGQIVAWGHLRSGGRRGSASIDELIAFGEKRSWRRDAADYAIEYGRRARADWEQFRSRYRPSKV
jgi:uncharacterized protein (DUF2252 family)